MSLTVIVSDGLKVTSVVEYTGVGISMRSAFVCLTIKKDMRFCSLKKDPCEEKVDEYKRELVLIFFFAASMPTILPACHPELIRSFQLASLPNWRLKNPCFSVRIRC